MTGLRLYHTDSECHVQSPGILTMNKTVFPVDRRKTNLKPLFLPCIKNLHNFIWLDFWVRSVILNLERTSLIYSIQLYYATKNRHSKDIYFIFYKQYNTATTFFNTATTFKYVILFILFSSLFSIKRKRMVYL